MAKVVFGTTFLGDGLVWLGSEYERLRARERALVWSERADVPAESPNFVWRIKAVVWAKRNDSVELAMALEELAVALGSGTGDLKIYEDDGATLLRTYPECRFDEMKRRKGPKASRRDFEDDIIFLFTTSQDPE